MKARLLAIGRFKSGAEGALFAQYNARLRPPLELAELPEARGSAGEIRAREGAALLAALPGNALLVALDLGGAAPSSEALAALTERWEATAPSAARRGWTAPSPRAPSTGFHWGRSPGRICWCGRCWQNSFSVPSAFVQITPITAGGGPRRLRAWPCSF